MIQDQIPKDYDFEKVRANDIFKYGVKVDLGKKLDYSFTDVDGSLVTKSLPELAYDVSKKLEELKSISAVGSNQGLEQKMELLNSLVGEISGKFMQLTQQDMINISKIVTNLGEQIKSPSDVGLLTRYLTVQAYIKTKDFEPFTLYLSEHLALTKRTATTTDKRAIQGNDKLTEYFEEKGSDKRILDLNTMTFYTFGSWADLGKMLVKSGREGLIDFVEYDDHPKTLKKKVKN